MLYDAVYVPGGAESIGALELQMDARHFVMEAFKHCKAIGGSSEGAAFVAKAILPATRQPPVAQPSAKAKAKARTAPTPPTPSGGANASAGVVMADAASPAFARSFVAAIAQHRHWARVEKDLMPA